MIVVLTIRENFTANCDESYRVSHAAITAMLLTVGRWRSAATSYALYAIFGCVFALRSVYSRERMVRLLMNEFGIESALHKLFERRLLSRVESRLC